MSRAAVPARRRAGSGGLRVGLCAEDLCVETRPSPCALAIFGASGDLAARKIFPSLAYLRRKKLLPGDFHVLGAGRSRLTRAELRSRSGGLPNVDYLAGAYDAPGTYAKLGNRLRSLASRHGTGGRVVFYLAVPPALYAPIVRGLASSGLTRGPGDWPRVIIEKPFGRDLASAERLDKDILRELREEQVYRIDHYLGKETVQNILVFRFANAIFEPVWNRRYVDSVQISALESLGVEHRAGYYDRSGVIRDMFQNHMLQLLALTAMEPPGGIEADKVRDRKTEVFRSLKPLGRDWSRNVVLGQYRGYRREPGVARDSATPTYAAMRLEISNDRWKGVPFYLRSGKKLRRRAAEIAVRFKPSARPLFGPLCPSLSANVLVHRIQPDEGISLTFETKKPGPKLCVGALAMEFDYAKVFGESPPEAYQRLLLDAMLGDQTLFIRRDAVRLSWKFFDPLLRSEGARPLSYASGSRGPVEADSLLERDGRAWRTP